MWIILFLQEWCYWDSKIKRVSCVKFWGKRSGHFLGLQLLGRGKKYVYHKRYVLDLLEKHGWVVVDRVIFLWIQSEIEWRFKRDSGRQRMIPLTYKETYYLSHMWPDIAVVVSVVSQFMHSPYEEHLCLVYRILRYLNRKKNGKGSIVSEEQLKKHRSLYRCRLSKVNIR